MSVFSDCHSDRFEFVSYAKPKRPRTKASHFIGDTSDIVGEGDIAAMVAGAAHAVTVDGTCYRIVMRFVGDVQFNVRAYRLGNARSPSRTLLYDYTGSLNDVQQRRAKLVDRLTYAYACGKALQSVVDGHKRARLLRTKRILKRRERDNRRKNPQAYATDMRTRQIIYNSQEI